MCLLAWQVACTSNFSALDGKKGLQVLGYLEIMSHIPTLLHTHTHSLSQPPSPHQHTNFEMSRQLLVVLITHFKVLSSGIPFCVCVSHFL